MVHPGLIVLPLERAFHGATMILIGLANELH